MQETKKLPEIETKLSPKTSAPEEILLTVFLSETPGNRTLDRDPPCPHYGRALIPGAKSWPDWKLIFSYEPDRNSFEGQMRTEDSEGKKQIEENANRRVDQPSMSLKLQPKFSQVQSNCPYLANLSQQLEIWPQKQSKVLPPPWELLGNHSPFLKLKGKGRVEGWGGRRRLLKI